MSCNICLGNVGFEIFFSPGFFRCGKESWTISGKYPPMSSAAAPPAFRWKTSISPFPQNFVTSTLLPYNLMYLPMLFKKLLFVRSEVGENKFLKMAQYL